VVPPSSKKAAPLWLTVNGKLSPSGVKTVPSVRVIELIVTVLLNGSPNLVTCKIRVELSYLKLKFNGGAPSQTISKLSKI
jgi:hypothetical protein